MTIDELIREYEQKILMLKKRYYYLKSFLDELTKRTNGLTFDIKNDILWQMMTDSYSMLIIDLASLYKNLGEQGGFFGLLKIHSAKLRKTSYRNIDAPEPNILTMPGSPITPGYEARLRREVKEDFQKTVAYNMEKCLYRLFPHLQGNPDQGVCQGDIEKLKDRILKRADEIYTDRDNLRAHRFQKGDVDKATLKGLTLKDVGAHFEYIEDFMNSLRMVTLQSSMDYNDMNHSNVKCTAEDVVDIIVMGSTLNVFNTFGVAEALKLTNGPHFYYQFRERFYAANSAPFGKPDEQGDK
jgi:hypothetical protein